MPVARRSLFACSLCQAEQVQAEEPVGIGPGVGWGTAGATRQRLELLDRIFVRILGVDALALGKTELAAHHPHRLAREAHEMHLDAALRFVLDAVVGAAGI